MQQAEPAFFTNGPRHCQLHRWASASLYRGQEGRDKLSGMIMFDEEYIHPMLSPELWSFFLTFISSNGTFTITVNK